MTRETQPVSEKDGIPDSLKRALLRYVAAAVELAVHESTAGEEIESSLAVVKALTDQQYQAWREELLADAKAAVSGAPGACGVPDVDRLIAAAVDDVLPCRFPADADSKADVPVSPPPPIRRHSCDRCAEPATTHVTEASGGERRSLHLCPVHALEHLTEQNTSDSDRC